MLAAWWSAAWPGRGDTGSSDTISSRTARGLRRASTISVRVVVRGCSPQRQRNACHCETGRRWRDGAQGSARTLGVPAAAPRRTRTRARRVGLGVHRRGQRLQAVAADGRVREERRLHAPLAMWKRTWLGEPHGRRAREPDGSSQARATLVHTGYSRRARWPNAGFMHAVENQGVPKGCWPRLLAGAPGSLRHALAM